jgi:hypothetical protein
MEHSSRTAVVAGDESWDGVIPQVPGLAAIQVAALQVEKPISGVQAKMSKRCAQQIGSTNHVPFFLLYFTSLLQVIADDVAKVPGLVHPLDRQIIQLSGAVCVSVSAENHRH